MLWTPWSRTDPGPNRVQLDPWLRETNRPPSFLQSVVTSDRPRYSAPSAPSVKVRTLPSPGSASAENDLPPSVERYRL